MVNGKPNLTFGGAAPVSNAKARQRNYVGGHNAESFASYLPTTELGAKPGAAQGAQVAQPGQQAAQARRFVPQQTGAEAFLSGRSQDPLAQNAANLNMGLGQSAYMPVAGKESAPAAARSRAALPATRQSRDTARTLAQPGPTGLASPQNALQAQPVAKARPVMSGVPVTRRHNFGMEDTRKSVMGAARNANMPLFNPKAAEGGAAVRIMAAPGNSAYNRYASMFSNLGGLQSPQSFVGHGFSGANGIQALKKLGYDVSEAQSITTYATVLDSDPYDPRARTANAGAAGRNSRQADQPPAGGYARNSLVPGFYASANQGLGALAAKFESGSEGIAAIGYDRKGGTSYGKYQIASRVGTMDGFIGYLQQNAPDLATRLSAAGPANTGGRSGRMPSEWRKIAEEQPDRFERLQSDFIRTSHFDPAVRDIVSATGLSMEAMPPALQEVLFSTAVQHGPAGASRIINQAVERVGPGKLRQAEGKKNPSAKKTTEQLITQIYNLRAGQFVSSSSRVQAAVRNRLRQEMREALEMLS